MKYKIKQKIVKFPYSLIDILGQCVYEINRNNSFILIPKWMNPIFENKRKRYKEIYVTVWDTDNDGYMGLDELLYNIFQKYSLQIGDNIVVSYIEKINNHHTSGIGNYVILPSKNKEDATDDIVLKIYPITDRRLSIRD